VVVSSGMSSRSAVIDEPSQAHTTRWVLRLHVGRSSKRVSLETWA
jgi:hypothetical protein